jgi:hypothetical protein
MSPLLFRAGTLPQQPLPWKTAAPHDRRAETVSRDFWGGLSISSLLRRRVIEAMTELITRLFAFTLVLLLAAAALLAALAQLVSAAGRPHS